MLLKLVAAVRHEYVRSCFLVRCRVFAVLIKNLSCACPPPPPTVVETCKVLECLHAFGFGERLRTF